MTKTVIYCLRIVSLCLALMILPLAPCLAGCTAKAPPLSPGAAAFKKEVREIIARMTPALAGPLARNGAPAAEAAIKLLYPTSGQEQDDFPFWLGVMTKDGILLAALPPGKLIGADFINYQLVKEALSNWRINKKRLYAPNGTSVYFVLAPVIDSDNLVGLVGLRLTAAQALKKWGITEPEFQALNLN